MFNSSDACTNIKVADFLQRPQEVYGDIVSDVFSTNDQYLKLSYSNDGLNVRVLKAGWGEVRIKLNPEKLILPLDNQQLVFDFKSENVAEIIVKFYSNPVGEDGTLRDQATQKIHGLNSGCNESVKVKLPKNFCWIGINPCYEGNFFIKNMIMHYQFERYNKLSEEKKPSSITNPELKKIFLEHQIGNDSDYEVATNDYLANEKLQDIQNRKTRIVECKKLLNTVDTIHQKPLKNKIEMEMEEYRNDIQHFVEEIRTRLKKR